MGVFGMARQAVRDFVDDDCPRMAAAMSYFTVFSLPPLLVLLLMLVGSVVDPADVQGRIETEMAGMVGADGARQIQEMIQAANRDTDRGAVATVLGIAALLFGATGAFGQLQGALNRAWEVAPDPARGGFKRILLKRLLSLGMVFTIAFLLLVSLVLSAALSAFGDVVGGMLGGVSEAVLRVGQAALSLALITLLFALMYKVVPDAKVAWRDVWVGAAVTAALFVAGKFGIGLYLARSDPGSSFGAAGALAIILVWIYYSAMIVFLGAEFTQVWARERGQGIVPEEGAVRLVEGRRAAAD